MEVHRPERSGRCTAIVTFIVSGLSGRAASSPRDRQSGGGLGASGSAIGETRRAPAC